jgi:hypothetical protein
VIDDNTAAEVAFRHAVARSTKVKDL